MKSVKLNGMTLTIKLDENNYNNPRITQNNLGKMYCWHNKYNLGDKNSYKNSNDFFDDKDLHKSIFVCAKIYYYEHGGIALSLTPFNCQFDSGTVGLIFATKDSVIDRYGNDFLKDKEKQNEIKDVVLKDLKLEIEEYGKYLNTEYYEFLIEDPNGEILERNGGFELNNKKEMLREMKQVAKPEHEQLFDKAIEQSVEMVM